MNLHLLVLKADRYFGERQGLDGIIDALIAAQHVMEMFRCSSPNSPARNRFLRLSKRLFKILAEIRWGCPLG
jgi:hypothetical protein